MDRITLNKNMKNVTGLNWAISSNDTSTAVDDTNYAFGEPVMPEESARKRKDIPYKCTPVSDDK